MIRSIKCIIHVIPWLFEILSREPFSDYLISRSVNDFHVVNIKSDFGLPVFSIRRTAIQNQSATTLSPLFLNSITETLKPFFSIPSLKPLKLLHLIHILFLSQISTEMFRVSADGFSMLDIANNLITFVTL